MVIEMNAVYEKYLNTVDRHLRPLPASERADIIKEIRGSILEMESEQLPEEQILKRLGDSRELAKAYLGDFLENASHTGFSFEKFSFKIFRNEWGFHLRRLLAVLAFYSLTGISGMFIIPTLGILAPVLILCGIIAPAAGFLKFVFSLFGYDMPYVVVQFGETTLSPAPAFLYSVVMGAVLILLGKGAWKLLLRYLKAISRVKRDWAV